MNQKQLLMLGKKSLQEMNIEDSYVKAKKVLEFILNQNPNRFVINSLNEVSKENEICYKNKIEEIINGKPVQYITNNQEFMGLNFFVDENVLIPQPDTEILVQTTIEKIKMQNYKNYIISVLDLCTGSGCIGVSIAKMVKNCKVIASDISNKALEIAKKNAILNNVEEKMEFICSDLFKNIANNQFEYIVSNPPYIETSIIKDLSKEVRNEPYIALNGGEDGLEFYKKILSMAPNYIKKNGYLILEIGYNQAQKVISIYNENISNNINYELILETKTAIKDFEGNDRVLIFKKK